jgi:hypothetical protein
MKSLFIILKTVKLSKRLSNIKRVLLFLIALARDVLRSVKHLTNYVRITFKVPTKNALILVHDQLDSTASSIICLFESSACFEQLCAHPQEDSCINLLAPEFYI